MKLDIFDSINNYVKGYGKNALFIDGSWGIGKTYYFNNVVIPKYKKDGYPVVYESSYGFSTLTDLKKSITHKLLLTQIGVSDKQREQITGIATSATKIMGFFSSDVRDSVIEILDSLEENYQKNKTLANAKPTIIVLDDIERLSKKIDVNDYLGFIMTELIEKLDCRVLLIGNINESDLRNSKTLEKVVSRVIPFKLDMIRIKKDFFDSNENGFLSSQSKWISTVINDLNIQSDIEINLRTIEFVNDTFKYIDKNLKDHDEEVNMKKSIYLNLLFISILYKTGELERNGIRHLSPLLGNRSFFSINLYDSENTNYELPKKIVKKFHVSKSITDYIMYSSEIIRAIFDNVFDVDKYIKEWRGLFISNRVTNDINKLGDFRNYDDNEIQKMQKQVISDLNDGKIKNISDLAKIVYIFNYLKNNDLIFIEDDWKKICFDRIKFSTKDVVNLNELTLRFPQIREDDVIFNEIKKYYDTAKNEDINQKNDETIHKIFAGDWIEGVILSFRNIKYF